ncbi:IS3 family transposase [Brevibacterium sp. JNUCC-42]|nr:IS3 family transposase [Brevibacterium sp. JNUCC-42]
MRDIQNVQRKIEDYIHFYNQKRLSNEYKKI